jgi:hypothetical protein
MCSGNGGLQFGLDRIGPRCDHEIVSNIQLVDLSSSGAGGMLKSARNKKIDRGETRP